MGATTGFASKCRTTRGIRCARVAAILRGQIEKTIIVSRILRAPLLPDFVNSPFPQYDRQEYLSHYREVSRRMTASDSLCPRSMAIFVPSCEKRNLSMRSEVK